MKVLFLAHDTREGQATKHRIQFPSRELSSRGYECDIIYGTRISIGDRTMPYISPSSIRYIMKNKDYDCVIMSREASPLGLLILYECKYLDIPVIFDMDDALYKLRKIIGTPLPNPATLHLNRILKESSHVTVGSEALSDHVRSIHKECTVIPTPVNTSIFNTEVETAQKYDKPVVGWMGSGPDHINNLELLVQPLLRLAQEKDFVFRIISALDDQIREIFSPLEEYITVDYGFNDWVSMEDIASEMQTFDVAVLPLNLDNEFMIGKSSMKVVEHMAMKIPVVASNEVSYANTITHGHTGYLADGSDDWYEYINRLIESSELRSSIGENGFELACEEYTVSSYADSLEEIVERLSQ